MPIRSVPLPAWTYLPTHERPRRVPAEAVEPLIALAHAIGELEGILRMAPGAPDLGPRLRAWMVERAALGEAIPASQLGAVATWAECGADVARGETAARTWSCTLDAWSRATGLRPGHRRAPAWIGPSLRTESGASTVPPPPNLFGGAIDAWQRGIDASAAHGESACVRGCLDAAWTLWCLHFIQPLERASGLAARLAAARTLAARLGEPDALVAPTGAGTMRIADQSDMLGSWGAWVRGCAEDLALDARTVTRGVESALAARAALLEAARSMRAPRHPEALAHAFVRTPRMSMQDAARAMGISFRAAQAVMGKFIETGLVREETGKRRDRLYACPTLDFVSA